MGRHRRPTTTVSWRLNNSTIAQLKAEAKAAKKPLGTYVRDLLEAYAPGTNSVAETREKAAKLRQSVQIAEL
jgi:predicted DNA-binding protein